jgi:hypothetical protein
MIWTLHEMTCYEPWMGMTRRWAWNLHEHDWQCLSPLHVVRA